MRSSSIPALVLALAGIAACAPDSDPTSTISRLDAIAPGGANPATHLYEVVWRSPIYWEELQAIPDVLVEIDGKYYRPGLATIETARENRIAASYLADGSSCWLGGRRVNDEWYWVSPPPRNRVTYSNWDRNDRGDPRDDEPDGTGDYLMLNSDGTWQDVADGQGTCFLVELVPQSLD